MTSYNEQTTEALIALLFTQEDRVTLEHIKELAARPDAVEPLREILRNTYYWEEGQDGKFWIELHAVSILCLAKAEAAIPELISAIELASINDMDWLNETLAGNLSQFGTAIISPLIDRIRTARDKYQESYEYSFVRGKAAETLIRIALKHSDVKDEVVSFLSDCLLDSTENDLLFNAFMGDQLVYLDREQTIIAMKAAYERGGVDETVTGDFDGFMKGIDAYKDMRMRELTSDPLEFYQPDEIAARQKRWKEEAAAEAKQLVAGFGPAALTRSIADGEFGGYDDDEQRITQPTTIVPEGYAKTAAGTVIRPEHTGRNEPCPCGSGKKFKKCCGK